MPAFLVDEFERVALALPLAVAIADGAALVVARSTLLPGEAADLISACGLLDDGSWRDVVIGCVDEAAARKRAEELHDILRNGAVLDLFLRGEDGAFRLAAMDVYSPSHAAA